jgi:hypothetical protein
MTRNASSGGRRSARCQAIRAADDTVAGTVALDGRAELVVVDWKGSSFVNITDKNQILEFDAKTLNALYR